MVIEHSASEGVTILRFLELFMQNHSKVNNRLRRQNSVELRKLETSLQSSRLEWNIDAQVEQQMRQSGKQADK